MLTFPNCKINIGLNILDRRPDSYHNLQTIFYPINRFYDAVEILSASEVSQSVTSGNSNNFKLVIGENQTLNQVQHFADVQYQSSGLAINGDAENNLCLKAHQLLKRDFPSLPSIHLFLYKNIPMGAGLGGGSADGAFTLQLLNTKFHLGLTTTQLTSYALELGSDCPFFIYNKPAFASGRGELLETISLDLSGYSIILVHPGIHISTAQAFSGVVPKLPDMNLKDLILEPIESWQTTIINDFAASVFKLHPLLSEIKGKLYASGAVYAAMSGSGSTIYGIYPSSKMPAEKLFPDFFELHTAL